MRTTVTLITLALTTTAWAGAPELLSVLDLPLKAHAAREAGIPKEEVSEALDAAKAKQVPAADAAAVLAEATDATKRDGTIDNFGGFVAEKLDSGLRGKELSDAIHAEHQARGMGKPDGKAMPEHAGGPPEGKGKPVGEQGGEHAGGPPEGKGKPDGARDADKAEPDGDADKAERAGGPPEGRGKAEQGEGHGNGSSKGKK